MDVDNTLAVYGTREPISGVLDWIDSMRENGIQLIILSNAKKERARRFGDSVGIEVIGLSMKPLPFGYFRAAKKLGIKRKNIAMIGDQYFTDILGGKLAGVKTVMVTDITPEDAAFFKLKRKAEKIMLKRWSK